MSEKNLVPFQVLNTVYNILVFGVEPLPRLLMIHYHSSFVLQHLYIFIYIYMHLIDTTSSNSDSQTEKLVSVL